MCQHSSLQAAVQEEADRIHASFIQCLTLQASGDGFEDQVGFSKGGVNPWILTTPCT